MRPSVAVVSPVPSGVEVIHQSRDWPTVEQIDVSLAQSSSLYLVVSTVSVETERRELPPPRLTIGGGLLPLRPLPQGFLLALVLRPGCDCDCNRFACRIAQVATSGSNGVDV